jgi:hypothetical protein
VVLYVWVLPAQTVVAGPERTVGVAVAFEMASVRAVTELPLQFTPFTLSDPVVKADENERTIEVLPCPLTMLAFSGAVH